MAKIIDSSDPLTSNQYSAWSPGIETEIPDQYRLLETIYDSKNVSSSIDEINALAQETGLSPEELVVFRPDRLALHELIVRVTADIVVLESELTRETVGTGIGLALVRQLAGAMHGDVEVVNCEPGAEFRIRFPSVDN